MSRSDARRVLLGDWRDVTGDRERDALITAAYAVEQREGERLGWARPPRLWTWHLAHLDSGAVELRPVPLHPRGFDNPVQEANYLAMTLPPPDRDAPTLAFADAPDGIAAVGMMTEAWAAPPESLTEEQKARARTGERVIAGLPQRIEMRVVTLADINGYGYTLGRVRGFAPELALVDRDRMWAPGGQGPGRLVRALYCLAYAARVGLWPGASS